MENQLPHREGEAPINISFPGTDEFEKEEMTKKRAVVKNTFCDWLINYHFKTHKKITWSNNKAPWVKKKEKIRISRPY